MWVSLRRSMRQEKTAVDILKLLLLSFTCELTYVQTNSFHRSKNPLAHLGSKIKILPVQEDTTQNYDIATVSNQLYR